ncbi:DUF3667 domain-containing protein [Marivirga salinae]|uniref:DUF3667 domain-containing protein n=1 Tax=Marivirga salinarum TaxID=3059078 RepID=A0AA51RC25_9BACT|nr:DUF3667 domain-containing protein [Marivirga sp. BDSF4-3]WMN12961.1 DUF3667 domain-containing protein [Marivirga sp. BDSF4-3]
MKEKLQKCLNCGEQLETDQNFCSNCGQENSDKKLALGAFLKDFFSNYLSFDTILFKTLNPFIFRPGKLTKAFNEGKRRRYINPIRLYLIFSLFYFFMISLTVPKDLTDSVLRSIVNQKPMMDSLKVEELDSAKVQQLIIKAEQNKVAKKEDSINKWATLKYWAEDETLSDEEFEANLNKVGGNIEGIPAKYKRSFLLNSSMFTYQAIRNLPLMMFFFLPIFAFILYLLFMKKRYFMEHLIHGLHLHAFAYFIYGLAILLISVFSKAEGWIVFISFIWVSLYTLFSIKRLYQNSWAKSVFKFFILGFFYFILLLFGFAFELYISFLTI